MISLFQQRFAHSCNWSPGPVPCTGSAGDYRQLAATNTAANWTLANVAVTV